MASQESCHEMCRVEAQPKKVDNSVNNYNCRFPTEMATKRENCSFKLYTVKNLNSVISGQKKYF